jgi:hypothetical protein
MSGWRRESGQGGPRRPLPRGWLVVALLASVAPLLPLGGAAQAAGPVDWPATQLAPTEPAALNAERGFAVASDGNLAAIGARFDGPHGEGVVYLFIRLRTGEWFELPRIVGHSAGEQFGISLALHGSTLAVGAAGEQRGQERPQGTVYRIDLSRETAVKRGTTIRRTEVITRLPAASDIGRALALDDTQLAVSAIVHGAAGDYGVVQVHSLLPFVPGDPGQSVVPVVQRPGDGFGESLLLSHGQLIVGAPRRTDDPLQPAAGAVFRFAPNPGPSPGWQQLETLRAADAAPHAEFGAALAASGGTVVVGAPGANAAPAAGGAVQGGDGDLRGPGAVYVFACDDSVCTQQAELTPAAAAGNERFGQAVSVSGGLLVGGAPLHAAGAEAPATGAAYAFNLQQDAAGKNVWVELGELPGSGTVPNALFGFAMAQSVDTVLVGAPLAGARDGRVAALTVPSVPIPLAGPRRRPTAGRPRLDSATSGRGVASP